MKAIPPVRMLTLFAPLLGALLLLEPSSAQQSPATSAALPSETPAKFEPATDSFDYLRRDVMIPMRDGVKLHTVILVPKGAKAAPILLTRTPYDATALTTHAQSAHLGPVLNGYDNAIMLDHHGNVTEGTVMNFFMVRGGQLVTPPRSTALLEGITRASILELAKAEGLEVVERQIARTELYLAEEAFFCGTAVQVAWIKQIDKRPISATIGPVTKGLQMKFNKIVRGQEPDYHEWLTVIQ